MGFFLGSAGCFEDTVVTICRDSCLRGWQLGTFRLYWCVPCLAFLIAMARSLVDAILPRLCLVSRRRRPVCSHPPEILPEGSHRERATGYLITSQTPHRTSAVSKFSQGPEGLRKRQRRVMKFPARETNEDKKRYKVGNFDGTGNLFRGEDCVEEEEEEGIREVAGFRAQRTGSLQMCDR